ncbi:hypothetical protein FBY31_3928 [Arthrobacter sp. SLBN-100]|uniref:hypothetical protein n=1 Tax=Arthrobacter sp. SLBN-100 TaxID=2768450 RepID=UPI001153710B|nr:hypothetical protein [Arthrobacter sp. SLBN-100]TQJ69757.1 hypothetical protein FBY31_3928 [Arthrobacter sp. SLBN-100]
MNRLARLVVASGAGLALALTAAPAQAAPPSDPGSNGAYVERTKYSSPYGSFDYRTVTQQHGENHYVINNREQQTLDNGSNQYSSDWKTHEIANEKVSKFSSHNTLTENGETCRMNSLSVVTNDVIRRDTSDFCGL